jgi:hypothetical protein
MKKMMFTYNKTSTWIIEVAIILALASFVDISASPQNNLNEPPQIDKSMSVTAAQQAVRNLIQRQWDWDGLLTVEHISVNDSGLSYFLNLKSKNMFSGGALLQQMGMEGEHTSEFKDMTYLLPPQNVKQFKGTKKWCTIFVLPNYKKKLQNFC